MRPCPLRSREVSISVLADLEAGRVEPFLAVLYEVVGVQVRRHPGAYEQRRDDPDLEVELAHDFVTERWDRTVSAVLGQARDDEALQRLLHTIVKNWLIGKFRESERGSVTRTLSRHLSAHAEFEKVPAGQPGAGRWRLTGTPAPLWGGSLEELVSAAGRVPATAVRWTSDTRRAPIAAAADLSAVLRTVLIAAAGSVSEQQLVEVIVRRFPATLSAPMSAPKVLDTAAEQVADMRWEPQEQWQAGRDAAATATAAEAVARQLTGPERHLLRLLATGPRADAARQVQQNLGCGRSKAYDELDRVCSLVRELAGAVDDGEQVVREVIVWCQIEAAGMAAVEDRGGRPSNTAEDRADRQRRAS